MRKCGICKRRMLHPRWHRIVPRIRGVNDRLNCGGECLRCMDYIDRSAVSDDNRDD